IEKGHGTPSDATAGFGLKMGAPAADGSYTITLTNSAQKDKFKGILMYVQDAADPKTHLGTFPEIDQANFKFQTLDICNAAQIQQDQKATFTHSNPSDKPLTTEFKWMPAASDAGKNAMLMAVVAGGGPNPWQVIPPMQFTVGVAAEGGMMNTMMGGGEGTTTTETPSSGSCNCQQQPKRVLKCKPKQKGGMMGGGEGAKPPSEGEKPPMMGGGEGEKPPMMGGGEGEKPPMGGEGKPPMGGEGKPPMGGEGKPPMGGEGKPPMGGEGKPPMGGEGKPPMGHEKTPKKATKPSKMYRRF
ncbi:hypothetical protein HK104_007724, partial [Borealophlyctis nickersoniae]